MATIRYVIEQNHFPFDDGTLDLPESAEARATLLERQALAFLRSFLRRTT